MTPPPLPSCICGHSVEAHTAPSGCLRCPWDFASHGYEPDTEEQR